MTAAYQTGVPTSPTNLLQTLVTWLVAQGWTTDSSISEGTGWRAHLHKGANYINLRATPGSETLFAGGVYSTGGQIGIGLYMGTGYSGASIWNAQPGGPVGNSVAYMVGCFMQLVTGAMIGYHFFDDGSDNIVVVVEKTSGVFTCMGWGSSLVKAGTWTGGAYFFSAFGGYWGGLPAGTPGTTVTANCPFNHAGGANSDHSAFVRIDVDSFTSKWISFSSDPTAQLGYTGKNGDSSVYTAVAAPSTESPTYGPTMQGRCTSAMNSQVNLLPIRLFAARDVSGHSLIGDVPNLFFSNGVGNGFQATGIYQISAQNYMMFPNFAVQKFA